LEVITLTDVKTRVDWNMLTLRVCFCHTIRTKLCTCL